VTSTTEQASVPGKVAAYTADTITVYQASGPEIADAAMRAGTFVAPFSRDRMTWIKPSFGWMMHRSGWAAKPGQERILTVEIVRHAPNGRATRTSRRSVPATARRQG
jgi:Domain of unknown function (DUF4291)